MWGSLLECLVCTHLGVAEAESGLLLWLGYMFLDTCLSSASAGRWETPPSAFSMTCHLIITQGLPGVAGGPSLSAVLYLSSPVLGHIHAELKATFHIPLSR